MKNFFCKIKFLAFVIYVLSFLWVKKIYTPFICEYNELILMPIYEIFEVKVSLCIVASESAKKHLKTPRKSKIKFHSNVKQSKHLEYCSTFLNLILIKFHITIFSIVHGILSYRIF